MSSSVSTPSRPARGLTYRHTVTACCGGSVTLAVSNNLPPLLFLIFHESFSIPLARITLLITLNFLIQLTVDLLAALFADRIGYRRMLVGSAAFAALGLIALGTLPFLFADAMWGLLIADILYALGGGLGEAIISPTVEACPMKNKAGMMGFLHSFYCWGTVAVILISTAFFALLGKEMWWLLPLLWSILPIVDAILLAIVPIPTLTKESEAGGRALMKRPLFYGFLLLMLMAGATELSVSQWASAFAEAGLQVTKAVGDLAGPCLFACLMGLARVFFAVKSEKVNLHAFLTISSALAIGAYLLTALPSSPALSLIGCGICGLAVGMLWPGLLSLAAAHFPRGGTVLFSLCALFGDLGCSLGPTLVGLAAEAADGALSYGLLLATAFPALLFVGLLLLGVYKRVSGKNSIEM